MKEIKILPAYNSKMDNDSAWCATFQNVFGMFEKKILKEKYFCADTNDDVECLKASYNNFFIFVMPLIIQIWEI